MVVVTGGAHGIGQAIVEDFRKEGAVVEVIDKTSGTYFVGDIGNKETLEAFSSYVLEKHSHIDYLINNALPIMKGIDECSNEEIQYALSVGVTAPFYLTKLFKDSFNKDAVIVNISSSRDCMSQANTESYTAAKGGITALIHALMMSLRGHVRVNSISQGWIDTHGNTYTGPDAYQHSSRRVGNPQDISSMVLFLCSPQASFINGENICIDGGMTKQMIYHEDARWYLEDK
ncbi:SDR family oxidoreductase [Catenibacterium mitsuokai]|uniref:SDR family oxidoreductase n=1 Tax=Catenibacterium mitsuokai TaxID=100886 RepID=UPI002E7973EF|nr:SDR family oxidoreductase [Catenibacterium mitsuokai]